MKIVTIPDHCGEQTVYTLSADSQEEALSTVTFEIWMHEFSDLGEA